MKNQNQKQKLVIFLSSLVIGILLSTQLRVINNMTGGIGSSQESKQLQQEFDELKGKREELEKELTELDTKLSDLKNSELKENIIEEELKKDIEKYDLLVGYREAKGPGILIKFQEPESEGQGNLLKYNYEFILSIINKLNASGAEGIAINGERYVATTDIKLVADQLKINDNAVFPPLEIRAIGNPDTLEATLNIRYGVLWDLRNRFKINANIEKSENIILPRYTRQMEFRYSQTVEDVE